MNNSTRTTISVPFSSYLIEHGLVDWLAIKAFESGDLTLGQLANALNKNEMIDTLNQLDISIADYDLQEDLDTITVLLFKIDEEIF